MVGKQRPNATTDALAKMRQAEQKVISALQHASAALRALGSVDSAAATPGYNQHSDAFITLLHEAQVLIRDRIQQVGPNLPFENVTLRRLVESDLALQRTAHVHRALAQTLCLMDEAPVPDPGSTPGSTVAAGANAGATAGAAAATAPSPAYMPSPAASTPMGLLGTVAASPPTGGGAVMMAVPSPDAPSTNLSKQVVLNGAQQITDNAMEDKLATSQEVGAVDPVPQAMDI